MLKNHRPIALIILDGWGYSENPEFNAIYNAKKPVWDRLWDKYPHTLLHGSGADVGLPDDQMGNSEVGHVNLGAGRLVEQEITKINSAIKSGAFFSNKVLADAIDSAKNNGKAIHIMGLLSQGGVHSHEDHIHAVVEMAANRGANQIYLHAFLDGRDTTPKSALSPIKKMESTFDRLGKGQFASIIGRYFAMDRDNRWTRTHAAYDLITSGKCEYTASSAESAVNDAYTRNESDEFIKPTAILENGKQQITVNDGDTIIFMNYRSDRARQLTRAFLEEKFHGFHRDAYPKLGSFVSLTEYSDDFDIRVAFPHQKLDNVFGDYISQLGLKQLRIAETEKYAHVTFFFNGGREDPFEGEDRILIPSPDVPTYDQQPQMSAAKVTKHLINAIESEKYDTIICNYANPDMLGHTGNYEATIEAIETIDECLGKVIDALLKVGGEVLISADHGNAEQMQGEGTGQAHTAHTSNPVPFIYVGRPAKAAKSGALSDITPTMLYLMGQDKPKEMNGQHLVELL
ncbi:MAG: 2,3-bisphosphoglycerate-independent phosphoglycerate mutase [Gammaproteobacteria bacterium]|nr:2,3-bisphosphoglycerate-independent phosphoglycerate mutase [Gammaproteobacteria bacterium]